MHLRVRIGAEINNRLAAAWGEDADPAVLRALELAYTGAMLLAGMGHVSYAEVPVSPERGGRVAARGAAMKGKRP